MLPNYYTCFFCIPYLILLYLQSIIFIFDFVFCSFDRMFLCLHNVFIEPFICYSFHHCVHWQAEKPKAPPSPKLVTNESIEVDEGKNETITAQPEDSLIPTPQKLDPG